MEFTRAAPNEISSRVDVNHKMSRVSAVMALMHFLINATHRCHGAMEHLISNGFNPSFPTEIAEIISLIAAQSHFSSPPSSYFRDIRWKKKGVGRIDPIVDHLIVVIYEMDWEGSLAGSKIDKSFKDCLWKLILLTSKAWYKYWFCVYLCLFIKWKI